MKFLIALVSILFMSNLALAIGDAGCGLGSVIISKNSKMLQTLASTTNGSTYTQFFGITSGTSNCTSSGFVNTDKKIEYFVEVNQDDLTRQMAQGYGEKLQVLAQLNGCVSPASQTSFFEMTQSSYNKILPSASATPKEIVNNLHEQISAKLDLKQMCTGA